MNKNHKSGNSNALDFCPLIIWLIPPPVVCVVVLRRRGITELKLSEHNMYHPVKEIHGACPGAIIVCPINGINAGFMGLQAIGLVPNIGLIMENIRIMGIKVMHIGFILCMDMDCCDFFKTTSFRSHLFRCFMYLFVSMSANFMIFSFSSSWPRICFCFRSTSSVSTNHFVNP